MALPFPYVAAWRLLNEIEETRPISASMTADDIRRRILEVAGAAYSQAVAECEAMVQQLAEDLHAKVGAEAGGRADIVRRSMETLRKSGPMYDRGVPDRAADLVKDFDGWWRPPAYRLVLDINHYLPVEDVDRGIAAAKAVFAAEGVDPWDAQCAVGAVESEFGTASSEDSRRARVWERAQATAIRAADPDGRQSDGAKLRVVETEPPPSVALH